MFNADKVEVGRFRCVIFNAEEMINHRTTDTIIGSIRRYKT